MEIAKALDVPHGRLYHPPFELFDLAEDPYELHDLADAPHVRDTRDELICALRKWMQETGDGLLDGPMAQGAYRQRMKEFKRIGRPGVE